MIKDKHVFQRGILIGLFLGASTLGAQQRTTPLWPSNHINSIYTPHAAPVAQLISYSSSIASPDTDNDRESQPPVSGKPAPKVVLYEKVGPFSYWQVGLKATSLGAGVDVATPLSRHLGLRGQFNYIGLSYGFDVDGVHYSTRFDLHSGSVSLDYYPSARHTFRISPGILFFGNSAKAHLTVPPGGNFSLGDNNFINSVDDPVAGDAQAKFHHTVGPMVAFGYNLIGHRDSRFTMPVELGVAYSGSAQININLNGTACNPEGCFTFADNPEAQASLQDEIAKINRRLSDIPVYPIISIGATYRFGGR
ncbi:MAG: hypothetical protein PW789_01280 [Edaphobacter sp.]|uniref:hypothetical protein n=1 Tax=Edaphobacter sp. TaxID=1934404 RepID=UPI00238BDC7C|nr:hypothetical protein [Edaphobacter sp.]MDE1175222.1 hypothetical protein [Edaphobacter sp.]